MALAGRARVPGDKSLAHRALLCAALAKDASLVGGLPDGADVAATRSCLEALGVRFEPAGRGLSIEPPARGLAKGAELFAANSGTTARLLAGLLAGRSCPARIAGDASLSRRPMQRVAAPLRRMGADIELTAGGLPLRLGRARLHAADWDAEVPSAQVKSAFLLAAVSVDGESAYRESVPTRDHSERMLPLFGADVRVEGEHVRVRGGRPLHGAALRLPGDPSSAAFLVVAALLVPGSDVTIEDVLLNPRRLGFATVLQRAGARLEIHATSELAGTGEPVGTMRAVAGELGPLAVSARDVPSLVDEAPLLALAAARAGGESRFEGLGELRVKESDRLAALTDLLAGLGVPHELDGDTLVVRGGAPLRACEVDARGDHRLAMLRTVASLVVPGLPDRRDEAVAVSWPAFYDALAALAR